MNVFLDLEKTVINDWYECVFLDSKIERIKSYIKYLNLKLLNSEATDSNVNLILFSAAVCNKQDLDIFNKQIKHNLEKKLGFTFNSEFLFSDRNWQKIAKRNNLTILPNDTIHDVFTLNIKEQIFNLIAIPNEINILFDDTVKNKKTEIFKNDLFSDKKTTIICVKM